MTRLRLMNTEIDNLTMDETLDAIDSLIKEDNCSYVVTPNVDHIVQLEKDEELKRVYENASLILTDGKPKKGYTMYLLGAAEGVADKAAKNLIDKYKGLNIVGTYSPPFGFEKDKVELKKIERQIQEVHPDILIVGLGCPKQEKYMYHHCKELGVPISFGLGASIDFEAGNIKRAPKWMSEHGLEWLYRITQDPKRLAKRYLVDDMKIIGIARKYRRGA